MALAVMALRRGSLQWPGLLSAPNHAAESYSKRGLGAVGPPADIRHQGLPAREPDAAAHRVGNTDWARCVIETSPVALAAETGCGRP